MSLRGTRAEDAHPDEGGHLDPDPDLSGTAVPNGTGDATGEAARVASTLVPMTAETSASGATAPRPAHRPTERTFHGDTVVDPYERSEERRVGRECDWGWRAVPVEEDQVSE